MADVAAPIRPADVAGLSAELCSLKRVRDARSPDSLACRQFRRAWSALLAGEPVGSVARAVTADTLAAVRLGGIDAAIFSEIGIDDAAARDIQVAALAEVLPNDPLGLAADLGRDMPTATSAGFVEALIQQPRAGATAPGKPRIILEPPETHGDHCIVVAVLGMVLAPSEGADPSAAFLAGLAHHFHNAVLPDSGFAGEVLLGAHLAPTVERLFDRVLVSLPAPLERATREALARIGDAETGVGRAFNAADVIDRVQEMHHFARVAAFTAEQALDDMQLVHAGPLQRFHYDVLRDAGLV